MSDGLRRGAGGCLTRGTGGCLVRGCVVPYVRANACDTGNSTTSIWVRQASVPSYPSVFTYLGYCFVVFATSEVSTTPVGPTIDSPTWVGTDCAPCNAANPVGPVYDGNCGCGTATTRTVAGALLGVTGVTACVTDCAAASHYGSSLFYQSGVTGSFNCSENTGGCTWVDPASTVTSAFCPSASPIQTATRTHSLSASSRYISVGIFGGGISGNGDGLAFNGSIFHPCPLYPGLSVSIPNRKAACAAGVSAFTGGVAIVSFY